MAYTFPGAEWVEQLAQEINQSEAYAQSAKTREGDFFFIIKSGPGLTEPIKIYLDLWHGKCRDAHIAPGSEAIKPQFTISGTLDTYRQVFEGQLDPIQALVTRKLDLQGNMMKILRSVKATTALVACCSRLDTAYPDRLASTGSVSRTTGDSKGT